MRVSEHDLQEKYINHRFHRLTQIKKIYPLITRITRRRYKPLIDTDWEHEEDINQFLFLPATELELNL